MRGDEKVGSILCPYHHSLWDGETAFFFWYVFVIAVVVAPFLVKEKNMSRRRRGRRGRSRSRRRRRSKRGISTSILVMLPEGNGEITTVMLLILMSGMGRWPSPSLAQGKTNRDTKLGRQTLK